MNFLLVLFALVGLMGGVAEGQGSHVPSPDPVADPCLTPPFPAFPPPPDENFGAYLQGSKTQAYGWSVSGGDTIVVGRGPESARAAALVASRIADHRHRETMSGMEAAARSVPTVVEHHHHHYYPILPRWVVVRRWYGTTCCLDATGRYWYCAAQGWYCAY